MDMQAPLSPELRLLPRDEQHDWRLDAATVAVGRRGIALARQALREARRHQDGTDATTDGTADTHSTAA